MKSFRYTNPLGYKDKPDLNEICKKIHDCGEEYWHSPESGWAELEFREGNEVIARLVFTKKTGFGFHVAYVKYPLKGEHGILNYFSWDESHDETIAKLYLGGDPIYVPKYLFIDENKMEKIVESFFQDGRKSKSVKWIEQKNLLWNIETGKPIPKKS